MIKKLAFSLMVVFSLSIASPLMASNVTQEPEKKENCQQKPECDKKKAECDETKKAESTKKEEKPCCKKSE